MKTSTQYLKHFNCEERSVLVPLLDQHVEYLCRMVKTVFSTQDQINKFVRNFALYYEQETCPEVAINAVFHSEIETHDNPKGFEAQYYAAQGHEHGYQRSRRVRYLWAKLAEIFAADPTLNEYEVYDTPVEEDCVSEVCCPICGEVVIRYTRFRIYNSENDWYYSSWEYDGGEYCEHWIYKDGVQSDEYNETCSLTRSEQHEFGCWVKNELGNAKMAYDDVNESYDGSDHYYFSNTPIEELLVQFRQYCEENEIDC